jgi:hypothetical protein
MTWPWLAFEVAAQSGLVGIASAAIAVRFGKAAGIAARRAFLVGRRRVELRTP